MSERAGTLLKRSQQNCWPGESTIERLVSLPIYPHAQELWDALVTHQLDRLYIGVVRQALDFVN